MSSIRNVLAPSKTGRDRWLILAFVVLSLFGLAMISSASAINSYINTKGASNSFYLVNQLLSLVISFIVLFVVQAVPYQTWRKLAAPAYGISILLLIVVLVSPVGAQYGTFARSWINIPHIPSIQPAEFAKLGLILYLAAYLTKQGPEKTATLKQGFVPFAIITGIIIALIMVQPDLGTSLVIAVIATAVYFTAGANILHLLLGAALTFSGALVIMRNVSRVANRFIAFLNPDLDPLGIGYQIQQALIAVGSGGLLGRGYGGSLQKFDYLPEAQGDSIFAIISEELGFLRTWPIVIGGFVLIAWRGYRIAERTQDPFARALAVGITTWICAQAFINIGVILALFPTTGVPLPFVSYGGSSLVATAIGMGILINISGYEHVPRHPDRWGYGWARRSRARRRPRFRTSSI
jgi:cell division protein FtsW